MDGDNDVMLAWFKCIIFVFLFLFLLHCRFGGYDPLALSYHVAFLCFLWLREEFVYVFNVYEGPGKVVELLDGLKTLQHVGIGWRDICLEVCTHGLLLLLVSDGTAWRRRDDRAWWWCAGPHTLSWGNVGRRGCPLAGYQYLSFLPVMLRGCVTV